MVYYNANKWSPLTHVLSQLNPDHSHDIAVFKLIFKEVLTPDSVGQSIGNTSTVEVKCNFKIAFSRAYGGRIRPDLEGRLKAIHFILKIAESKISKRLAYERISGKFLTASSFG